MDGAPTALFGVDKHRVGVAAYRRHEEDSLRSGLSLDFEVTEPQLGVLLPCAQPEVFGDEVEQREEHNLEVRR